MGDKESWDISVVKLEKGEKSRGCYKERTTTKGYGRSRWYKEDVKWVVKVMGRKE